MHPSKPIAASWSTFDTRRGDWKVDPVSPECRRTDFEHLVREVELCEDALLKHRGATLADGTRESSVRVCRTVVWVVELLTAPRQEFNVSERLRAVKCTVRQMNEIQSR